MNQQNTNVILSAIQSIENGKLDDAEHMLYQVIKSQPKNFDALHILGIVKGLKKNPQEALEFFRKALKIDENNSILNFNIAKSFSEIGDEERAIKYYLIATRLNPVYTEGWLNLGKSLSSLHKFEESLRCSDKAISLKPDYVEAWINRGAALAGLKQYEHALLSYDKALHLKSASVEAWSNRGVALAGLNQYEQALSSYDRAISLMPECVEAWSNRGVALVGLNQYEQALASYNKALSFNPDYVEAWSRRGALLLLLNQFEQALLSYDKAISLKPDYVEAWSNRGVALTGLNQYEQAIASHDKAISLKSDYAESWSNRGVALAGLNQYEQALFSHDKAISLNPGYAEAWSNRGIALANLNQYEKALSSYEKTISIDPNHVEANYNKGYILLRQREFLQGYDYYQWRWRREQSSGDYLRADLPPCEPKTLGGHVLFWAEQGLGDEIFYSSMLSQARPFCSKITLSADKRLHSIFKRSFPNIDLIDRKITFLDPLLHECVSSQAPIGDLGRLLELNSEILSESRKPFLLHDKVKTEEFKKKLPFTSGAVVCGLSWKSFNKDLAKSKNINLQDLGKLFGNEKISFVNLQYGDVNNEIECLNSSKICRIHNIDGLDLFNDIDGLLSLIEACDFIVTTSNVTAHLAGSIGKRGCLLVPYSKGKIWYWHLNDEYSFWYPSLKVFYQEKPNDWASTIEKMINWLEENYL